MYAALLLKGLSVGFSIAAPVGPIGILCIRRSLSDGPRVGFICGLGRTGPNYSSATRARQRAKMVP